MVIYRINEVMQYILWKSSMKQDKVSTSELRDIEIIKGKERKRIQSEIYNH